MKSIIQNILRLFRDKAVCSKCAHVYYVPKPVRHKINGVSMICYLSHSNTVVGKKCWIPLDEINRDGRCTTYKKGDVVTTRDKCNMIKTKPALNDALLAHIKQKIEKCPIVTICPSDSNEVYCMLCTKYTLSTEELVER